MKGVWTFLLAFFPWTGKGENWGSEEDKVLQHKRNGYLSVNIIFNGKATLHGKSDVEDKHSLASLSQACFHISALQHG